jgi:hypothetical protein
VSTKRSARQTPPGQANRPGRPTSPGRPGSAARQASETRRSAEQRSAAPLIYLRQLPSWLPPVVILALFVIGLAVRGWAGAVALCAVAAFLAWLALLSWPALTARGRLGRVLAIAVMLGLAGYVGTR